MDGTLEQAKAALHASSFDLAETGFRAILGGADGIEALHCLGLIALQRGDLAGALMLIQAAHHLAPSARMAHNLAMVLWSWRDRRSDHAGACRRQPCCRTRAVAEGLVQKTTGWTCDSCRPDR
jgi:Flp pilus assembly protein TadD